MLTPQRIVGSVLNVFLAGLGFVFAPAGKRTRGIFWFGTWLIGILFGSGIVGILFANNGVTFTIVWTFVINIWSAVEFFRISGAEVHRRKKSPR